MLHLMVSKGCKKFRRRHQPCLPAATRGIACLQASTTELHGLIDVNSQGLLLPAGHALRCVTTKPRGPPRQVRKGSVRAVASVAAGAPPPHRGLWGVTVAVDSCRVYPRGRGGGAPPALLLPARRGGGLVKLAHVGEGGLGNKDQPADKKQTGGVWWVVYGGGWGWGCDAIRHVQEGLGKTKSLPAPGVEHKPRPVPGCERPQLRARAHKQAACCSMLPQQARLRHRATGAAAATPVPAAALSDNPQGGCEHTAWHGCTARQQVDVLPHALTRTPARSAAAAAASGR